jgi:asparagine synthase (glutamine-hydrolysing)
MCGIVGETSFQTDNVSEDWARTGCKIMSHRGPDGEGIVSFPGAVLGHRRLSIIDLSTGDQPLSYGNGRYWITYNGEIYNYRELRDELYGMGYAFGTTSDTEVILAAYAAWGVACLKRLNGIFAFGIWDTQERNLLLARDHLGVKPLLYHTDNQGLRFSSELKALLAHKAVAQDVDRQALQDYMALGYVMAPRTIIRGIHKLPGGHYLLAAGGKITTGTFWNLEAHTHENRRYQGREADCIEAFEQLFADKVKQQMVSDVPVGAFLSGGIDSSAIAFHAAHESPGIRTFSIGFEEASYSELDYAELAAGMIGSDHHQHVVKPPSLDDLSDLVWFYDEPLGDTSIIPTYFVSKLAREHVKVVLSGDGGDEILAGYDTYLADWLQMIYARMPGWLHGGVVQPLIGLVPTSYKKVSLNFMLKQFVSQAHGSPQRAHFGWRMMFNENERSALTASGIGGDYSPFDSYAAHYGPAMDADWLTRSQYVDIKTWLVDDILVKVDRASMACSLESRVPFLAPDLVEFALSMPPGVRLKGLTRKYALKKVMRPKLTRQITDRKKRGFNAPISIWMRGVMGDEIEEMLRNNSSDLVNLDHPVFRTMWNEHRSGQCDHGFKLWTLLSLLLWEQRVLSNINK